jgi:hypothetical protein
VIPYSLEHIFSYNATIANPPEVVGEVPEGLRVNFYVTGGEVTGPRLRGKVRPAGGDWLLMRKDGVALLDVRVTIESHDGAVIYVAYAGLVDLGEQGYAQFLRGEPPARGTPIRTSPRCWTAHPSYQWLNRLHCLGIGEAHVAFEGTSEVVYDVYAVK